MTAEFWAAIAGALVGGFIALLTQLLALRAAAQQRRRDAQELRKSLARATLFKMLTIHSNFEMFRRYIDNEIELARLRGSVGQTWTMLRPIPNLPHEVNFSPDEMSLVLSLQDDVFNAMASMDQLHNSTIGIFRAYARERTALTAMLPAMMEGEVGIIEFSTETERHAAEPRIVEVNSLAEALTSRSAQDAQESGEALSQLLSVFNSKLGLQVSLEPKALS